jgi:hypothetical protein
MGKTEADQIESYFEDWFYEGPSPYSFRCELFYGDCLIKDHKKREQALLEWLIAAYSTGYKDAKRLPKAKGRTDRAWWDSRSTDQSDESVVSLSEMRYAV